VEKTHDTEHESRLIQQLILGDKKAYSALFYAYAGTLLKISIKYVSDEEEAKEVVQETFYRVWKYRGNMNASLSFKAYIITIAKRLIFNRAKKRFHELAYQEYFIKSHINRTSPIEEYIDFKELDLKIQNAIENLPSKRKEIFILSRIKGMTNFDISQQLQISVSTVENQINKAIKQLRGLVTALIIMCSIF
jgi:RNA polymerase sigma-70 factor (family 1)